MCAPCRNIMGAIASEINTTAFLLIIIIITKISSTKSIVVRTYIVVPRSFRNSSIASMARRIYYNTEIISFVIMCVCFLFNCNRFFFFCVIIFCRIIERLTQNASSVMRVYIVFEQLLYIT